MSTVLCIFVAICVVLGVKQSLASPIIVKAEDLGRCEKFSKYGSQYGPIHSVDRFKHQALRTADDFIHLPIYARTTSSVYVLLLSGNSYDSSGYGLGVQTGVQKKSEIRAGLSGPRLVQVNGQIPSSDGILAYTVRLSRNNTLSATFTGESSPLISYQLDNVHDINYVAFGVYQGHLDLYFDCPPETNLWNHRVAPHIGSKSNVVVNYDIESIAYHVHESLDVMKGKLQASWTNAALEWDPANYGRLTDFNMEHYSKVELPLKLDNGTIVMLPITRISYNGTVYANAENIILESKCYSHWSVDGQHRRVQCDLSFAMSQPDVLSLQPTKSVASEQSWRRVSERQVHLWLGNDQSFNVAMDSRKYLPIAPTNQLENKFQVLDEEMRHCKHSSQTGYIYNDFIHVDLFENKLGHGDYIIQMPLYVRADQDAHILLSADRVDQAQQVKGSASVYEIVLGRYDNEVNAIRTGFMGNNVVLQLDKPNILSLSYWVPITVQLTQNGTLSVSITGQSEPIIAHNFYDPLNVRWISFASHDYQQIDVAYDCHLSPQAKLWRNMFAFKDLSMFGVSSRSADFIPESYSYNLTHRTVETTGQFTMELDIPLLNWDPRDYGNLSSFDFSIVDAVSANSWNVAMSLKNGTELVVPVVAVESFGVVYAESGVTKITTQCGESSYEWAFESVACRNMEKKRHGRVQ